VLAQQQVVPDRIRPLRRIEYEALVERGMFEQSRVELLCGALVEMTPQGPLHADVVSRLSEHLIRALPKTVRTRIQSPLALADDSEPEPDIAVVPAGDYDRAHPTQALLVVEVAESSLQKDRGVKAALYATAGIPEFWLVNLAEKLVEVHRTPRAGRYDVIVTVGREDALRPSALLNVEIAVSTILP
jgi:Uma2 family endonuclease